jgi:hypothetical protein
MLRSVFCAALITISIAAAQPELKSWSNLTLVRIVPLKAPTFHVQGVDFAGRMLWVTAVDSANRKGYLDKFDFQTGERVGSLEIQDGVRFHPGGLDSEAESLWIPLAEYRAHSTSLIERRDKRDLKLRESFTVADHIGCIAAAPNYLIGGNWDSKDFYIWDHRGNLVRKIPSETGNAYQDMKFEGGRIVASGLLKDHTGAIDWLEFPSMRLLSRTSVPTTDRGESFAREGMAIRSGQLIFLPEDDPSRVFLFKFNTTR